MAVWAGFKGERGVMHGILSCRGRTLGPEVLESTSGGVLRHYKRYIYIYLLHGGLRVAVWAGFRGGEGFGIAGRIYRILGWCIWQGGAFPGGYE